VVTINTKHHQAGKLALDGDHLTVNGHRSDYIANARREAGRAAGLLTTALAAVGRDELAAALRVRPVLAIVGARSPLVSTQGAQPRDNPPRSNPRPSRFQRR
jgi:hypothetical protein